jgi:hypothetical protein
VEVAPTFSTSLANANNYDLASNVSYNSGQTNEYSGRVSAPLEYKSDSWYAEIASIKADLAALMKGKSELKECEKKNDSDFYSKSVLLKEPSLVVKDNAKQNKTTMLYFPKAGVSYFLLAIVILLTDKFRLRKVQKIKLL